MFSEITLHDYRKPLAYRTRRVTGPYRWKPTPAGSGRGFYMQHDTGGALECARHGAGFRLRLYPANDFLPSYSRLSRINGYYSDPDFSDDALIPIVAKLPRGRGYLAGWTMGPGMCATIAPDIHDSADDAAMAAHDEAERAAEAEREWREREREECEECGEPRFDCECDGEAS